MVSFNSLTDKYQATSTSKSLVQKATQKIIAVNVSLALLQIASVNYGCSYLCNNTILYVVFQLHVQS